MILDALAWICVVAIASLIGGMIAALSYLATKKSALATALGTLTMPALLCASVGYWVLTMEADDAPPGAVLMGALTALSVVTPTALLASRLTVKFLSRRVSRNVR